MKIKRDILESEWNNGRSTEKYQFKNFDLVMKNTNIHTHNTNNMTYATSYHDDSKSKRNVLYNKGWESA